MTARHPNLTPAVTIALLALAVACLACQIPFGRDPSSRFEAANAVFLDATSTNKQRKQARAELTLLLGEFTSTDVEALPPEERGAGFVLRANALWRINHLESARISSRRAQIEPGLVPGSHADIMSVLLPGLILSSREIRRWNNSERAVSKLNYDAYERNFSTALEHVAQAEAKLAPNTPGKTRAFVHYSRWRIATDWRWVLASQQRTKGPRGAKLRARRSKTMLDALGEEYAGLDSTEAVSALVQRIPKKGSLRNLAVAESNRPPSEQ